MRRAWAALACAATLAAAPARADIWGFVDDKGVAHFASQKLDERYELFFKSGESFDTTGGVQQREPVPRAVAVPTAQAKLLAYFEFAPGFKQVRHHLREASDRHGIDIELLQALIATESGFDVDAVSPKGAVGLMQIMPATAERYGVKGDARVPVEKKLTDPKVNVRTGARYLHDLLRMFPGRLDLALAAYNAGEGAVIRAGHRIPNYRETQNYVKTVLQLYEMLKPPVAAQAPRAPARVRMELPGAAARRNMPPAPQVTAGAAD